MNINRIKSHRRKGRTKGENGKLPIVGVSKEYTRAPALAGIAALRSSDATM